MIKAEWLKQKRNNAIIILNLIILLIVLGLYLWSAFGANGDALQLPLRKSGCAGAYGLVVFTTLCRKMWAILYGYLIVNMELTENRSDFFIQNSNRKIFWSTKIVFGAALSALFIVLSYIIPSIISAVSSKEFNQGISIGQVIIQMLLIWIITVGNIILGMILALLIKDAVIVAVIVFTLEYFSNLFPKVILFVWEKIDGYWYVSNLLKPIKNQLLKLNNFAFSLSESFTGITGVFLWITVLCIMIFVSFWIFIKKEF